MLFIVENYIQRTPKLVLRYCFLSPYAQKGNQKFFYVLYFSHSQRKDEKTSDDHYFDMKCVLFLYREEGWLEVVEPHRVVVSLPLLYAHSSCTLNAIVI